MLLASSEQRLGIPLIPMMHKGAHTTNVASAEVSNPVPSLTEVVRKTLSSTWSSAVPETRSKQTTITGNILFRLLHRPCQRKVQLMPKEPRRKSDRAQRENKLSVEILGVCGGGGRKKEEYGMFPPNVK